MAQNDEYCPDGEEIKRTSARHGELAKTECVETIEKKTRKNRFANEKNENGAR